MSDADMDAVMESGRQDWRERTALLIGEQGLSVLESSSVAIVGAGGVGGFAAEMLAANKGLGYMILMGRTFGRIDIIMGGMVMIGILGIIFNIIFDAVENYVLRWRR